MHQPSSKKKIPRGMTIISVCVLVFAHFTHQTNGQTDVGIALGQSEYASDALQTA